MKYITYINKHGVEDIRIFSKIENHKDIAFEMRRRHLFDLLGAGFVTFNPDGSVTCGGASTSLNLDSRGGLDSKILNNMLERA